MQVPGRWLDEDEEWFSCPLLFINQGSIEFINEYDSYNSRLAMPKQYNQQTAKFFEAVKYFESCVKRFTEMKQGKE